MAAVLVVAVLPAWSACVPVGSYEDPEERVEVDFTDPVHRALYDFQDQLLTDSLVPRLANADPAQRYLAARAFGSIIDEDAIPPLLTLLHDPVADVRAVAAYAIGQQGRASTQDSLLAAFDQADTAGVYTRANAAILEAVGKVGDSSLISALSSVTTYLPGDTALLLGQTRGLYRFATRGFTNAAGTELLLGYATDGKWPRAVRLMAAHYLQRAELDLSDRGEVLLESIRSESDQYVRMALIRGAGKAPDSGMVGSLVAQYQLEREVLPRVELVRSLGVLPYLKVRPTLLAALNDPEPLVAETAAEMLREHGTPKDAIAYWRLAKDSLPSSVQLRLYAAAMRHLPGYAKDSRNYINGELRRRFAASTLPYERAEILRAMGEYPWNYRYLMERTREASTGLVETTAAAEALDAIAAREESERYFRGSWPNVRRQYAAYIRDALQGPNAGLQAVAATTLARKLEFDESFTELEVLTAAQAELALPRDTETFYALERAHAALSPGYTARLRPPDNNHPIAWDTYRSLQPGLEVVVQTERGNIVIDLFEEAVPGTVVNFVQLARNSYYNGKLFHRVVPDFVTQGGGSRGDGYGGLDYSIRTETPPLYYDRPGLVGMASAGRHTEGVQFFFTHQPTPHLDGRYTVFGRVVEGLEVIPKLRVGDAMRVSLR